MALLGLNLGQRCVVLTVFLVFGALSLFLIIFHVEAEAQFDQLKIGGAPFPGTFTNTKFALEIPPFRTVLLRPGIQETYARLAGLYFFDL